MHKKMIAFLFSFFFSFFVLGQLMAQDEALYTNYLSVDHFDFKEAVVADLGEPLLLWATNYHLPEITEGAGDIPLRDLVGNELGPKLSLPEWCKCALEGSMRIVLKDGTAKTFNYSVSNELFPIDCSAFYPFNVGKSKFKLSNGPFGDGIFNYRLSPFRTLATDPTLIPTGSVLYIPEARGTFIILPNGEIILHDGYFYAGDIGGAIKLNHIDVFIGTHEDSSFFPWVSHTSLLTFKAYLIKDQEVIDALHSIHRRSVSQ